MTNIPFITLNDQEVDVNDLKDGSVTLAQYETMRANTPGWRAILPKLNAEALGVHIENNLSNALLGTIPSEPTYDAALKHYIVPELLRRVTEREEDIASRLLGVLEELSIGATLPNVCTAFLPDGRHLALPPKEIYPPLFDVIRRRVEEARSWSNLRIAREESYRMAKSNVELRKENEELKQQVRDLSSVLVSVNPKLDEILGHVHTEDWEIADRTIVAFMDALEPITRAAQTIIEKGAKEQ